MDETRALASACIDVWKKCAVGPCCDFYLCFAVMYCEINFPTFVRKLWVTETLTTHEGSGRKQEVNKEVSISLEGLSGMVKLASKPQRR